MNKTIIAMLVASLTAAPMAVAPVAAAVPGDDGPVRYADDGGGSGGIWLSDPSGGDYYSSRGGWSMFNHTLTLPPQTIYFDRRWSEETISTYTSVNLTVPFMTRYFDSRTGGVDVADDKKTTPPEVKNRDLCLKNCNEVQVIENALCDDRSNGLMEATGTIATLVFLRIRWTRSPFRLIGYDITPREIWATGGAIGATYGQLCKARATDRAEKCRNQTCKA